MGEIKVYLEGDVLTRDYGDYESIEPIGSVVIDGDKRYYYLHDFRFKFCMKLH